MWWEDKFASFRKNKREKVYWINDHIIEVQVHRKKNYTEIKRKMRMSCLLFTILGALKLVSGEMKEEVKALNVAKPIENS